MDIKFVFDKLRNPDWNSIVAVRVDESKSSSSKHAREVMGGCVYKRISTNESNSISQKTCELFLLAVSGEF